MDLQNMVKSVHRKGENVVLVEFDKGIIVEYAKTPSGTMYKPLTGNDDTLWGSSRVKDNESLREHYPAEKNSEYRTIFKSFRVAQEEFLPHSYQTKLKENIENSSGQIVDSLELEQHVGRNWGQIGWGLSWLPLAPLSLITIPLVGLFAYAARNRKSNEGDLGVALLGVAPLMLPYEGIRELTNPSTLHMSIGKEDCVIDHNEGRMPAIVSYGRLDHCRQIDIIFPTGDSIYIGTRHDENEPFSRFCYADHERTRESRKEEYATATQFLQLERNGTAQMNSLLEERAAFPEVQKKFVAGLNRENQEALLKSIGFI